MAKETTTLSEERQLEMFREISILRMSGEPMNLATAGFAIKNLAKAIGENPNDMRKLLAPLYEEAVKRAFSKKGMKKNMRRFHHDDQEHESGYYHDHGHHGGH